MSDIIIPLIFALIICLIFNKPLDNLAQKLENKSNELIKKYKQKIKNINIKNENKLDPTFKNIIIFYLGILSIYIVAIMIIAKIGMKTILLIITIIIISIILQAILKNKYRAIIITIIIIGAIIIGLIIYIHRYDIMLYNQIDKLF